MPVVWKLLAIVLALGLTGCFGNAGEAGTAGDGTAGSSAAAGGGAAAGGTAAGDGAAAGESAGDGVASGGASAAGGANGSGGPSGAAGADDGDAVSVPEFDGPYMVLAERLEAPWSIAFDGDSILVSEREGTIVRIGPDGKLERKTVHVAAGVAATGESGFLGFALAPDFPDSRTAYAYHTYERNGRMLNRVVLLEERDDAWTEIRPLIEDIPGSRIHDGGRIAIGPDGYIYITTGDAGQGTLAKNRDSLAGKILRMAADGSVPEDNPFPNSYVYSYGHRNPQGIAWTADGTMYAAEHGPSGNPGGHDEINLIEAGNDYGWPDVYGDAVKRGAVPPLYHSGKPPAIAPSGMAATDDGKLLLATLRGETLFLFDPASPDSLQPILKGEGRLRDVAVRGKYAYVLTNNTDGRGMPSPEDDRLLLVRLPE